MNRSTITASLVVCVAAAGVAVGALTLDSGGSSSPAAGAPTGDVGPAAPAGGGYGADANATTDAGGPAGPAAASLDISGFQFGTATVGAGGQVTVNNRDSAPHTVTSDDGAFDSGQVGGGGAGAFVAPSQPGSYGFHCEIHPGMTGTLTVG